MARPPLDKEAILARAKRAANHIRTGDESYDVVLTCVERDIPELIERLEELSREAVPTKV